MIATLLAILAGFGLYCGVRDAPHHEACTLSAGDQVRPKIGGPIGMVVYNVGWGEVDVRFTATSTLVEMKCFEVEKVINQKGK